MGEAEATHSRDPRKINLGEALQEPNSLSPVQRPEGISPKMQCGTTERSEFLILRVYSISKISLSLSGKVCRPRNSGEFRSFCFFF